MSVVSEFDSNLGTPHDSSRSQSFEELLTTDLQVTCFLKQMQQKRLINKSYQIPVSFAPLSCKRTHALYSKRIQ